MRVLRPEELGEGERERWRELRAAADAPRNPFMEPEFSIAVARVRPRARVAVLYEGGQPAGFLPYERGALGRGRAIGLGVSDRQGAVLAPGAALETGELLRACSVSSLAFDNLEAGQGLFVPYAAEEHATYVIDVEKGYETYESALRTRSPKFLRTTLAKERRLGRRSGPVRFVFDERDPAALRTLMEWKSAQYRRTGRRDGSRRSGSPGSWAGSPRPGPASARARCRSCTPGAAPSPRTSGCVRHPSWPAGSRRTPRSSRRTRRGRAASADGRGGRGRGHRDARHGARSGRVQGLAEDRELAVYEGAATRPGVGAALHRLSREPCAARTASSAPVRAWRRWRHGP
ncbi:hypothetical protein GCM10023238_21440 [Streptomyces heliomycini]